MSVECETGSKEWTHQAKQSDARLGSDQEEGDRGHHWCLILNVSFLLFLRRFYSRILLVEMGSVHTTDGAKDYRIDAIWAARRG